MYKSWEGVQKEKYRGMARFLGTGFFRGLAGKRVLDIGCGPGYLEQFLEENGIKTDEVVGLDKDAGALKAARFIFVAGDGSSMPFKAGSFDAVIAIDSMHLFGGTDFGRVLKSGGIALLATFFSSRNCEERKKLIRLASFDILMESEIRTQENEYFVLARKRQAEQKSQVRKGMGNPKYR